MTQIAKARNAMRNIVSAVAVTALGLVTAGTAAAACATLPVITVIDHVALGTFTRPDTGSGSSFVTLNPEGVRTLPPNLRVTNDSSRDVFRPARIQISGPVATCPNFSISLSILSGDLSQLSLAPASGYTFVTATTNAATGRLDSLGKFVFYLGVRAEVRDQPGASVAGSVNVQVTLRD